MKDDVHILNLSFTGTSHVREGNQVTVITSVSWQKECRLHQMLRSSDSGVWKDKMVRYTYIWLCTYLNLQQDDLNQDFEIDSKSRILDFASMVREETTCQLKLQNIDSPYHLSFYVLRDDQAPELDLGNQDSTSRRYRALVLLISSYLSSIRGHTESQ